MLTIYRARVESNYNFNNESIIFNGTRTNELNPLYSRNSITRQQMPMSCINTSNPLYSRNSISRSQMLISCINTSNPLYSRNLISRWQMLMSCADASNHFPPDKQTSSQPWCSTGSGNALFNIKFSGPITKNVCPPPNLIAHSVG